MTDYYVKAGGDGLDATTDPGTSGDWSKAFPSWDAAVNAGPAGDGDRLFISDAHAETNITGNLSPAAVATARNRLIAYSVENLDTSAYSKGAQVTNNGNIICRSVTSVLLVTQR